MLIFVYADFWEGMYPSSWKLYDSIDYVVRSLWFLWHAIYHTLNFNNVLHTTTFKQV